MIGRVLPYPIVSLGLLLLWLLLNESLSLAHIVLGSCLAIGGGFILRTLEPSPAHLRRPGALLNLGWLVLVMHNTSGLTFYPDPDHEWDGGSLADG